MQLNEKKISGQHLIYVPKIINLINVIIKNRPSVCVAYFAMVYNLKRVETFLLLSKLLQNNGFS